MGLLFEHALVLFYGGRAAWAESLFQIVLDAPSNPETEAIQANAAFRIAQILRCDGRKPEAIAMARRGLEICGETSWFVIGRLYDANMQKEVREKGVTGGLATHLIRLLAEMRFDPSRAVLPDRVGVVSVSTPNADNPEMNVFYRVPPEIPGREGQLRRALILVPSLNHDVLEYLQPGNPWARFADRQGLVLVCPRFYCTERSDRAQHAFTYYINPQSWSGKALLDALDKIAERSPLRKESLLFHSFGSGAGYAARFARWRPDLVAAVSSHGGGAVLPWFQEYPGLHPLGDLQKVRFFVSGGEDDDYAENTQNRIACAEAMVTVLRGAGVKTEWRPFPGVGHFPTPELEAASQEFLARQ
jgi:predicted esterase